MRVRDNNYDKFKALMDEICATTEEILGIHTGKQP
jgi:hypothetical protein